MILTSRNQNYLKKLLHPRRKKAVLTQLEDAESKLKIQTAVNKLFTKNVSNWQQAVDDVIIKEKLASADVARVRENMSFFKDSAWKTVVMQYLGFADTQIAQVTQLDQLFDTMLKDGQVTATATYDQYLTALSQIEQIRNEKNKRSIRNKSRNSRSANGL